MNKQEVIQSLLNIAKTELKKLEAAHTHVAEGVNNPESKQEGKYDTRALLDSYLAGGQEARIKQLKYEINIVEQASKKEGFSRLIRLQDQETGASKFYLFISYLGGYKIESSFGTVQTISPKTPIAITLSDKEIGDILSDGALAGYKVQNIL